LEAAASWSPRTSRSTRTSEVAAIQKHFDAGRAALQQVKGYPNARICNNIFGSASASRGSWDVDDREAQAKVVEARSLPAPSR